MNYGGTRTLGPDNSSSLKENFRKPRIPYSLPCLSFHQQVHRGVAGGCVLACGLETDSCSAF